MRFQDNCAFDALGHEYVAIFPAGCRFEIRFVEEAAAARRVAAAYRVYGLVFDESTKLGLASLTPNLVIQPIKGAPFEDVILRAAYTALVNQPRDEVGH